MDRKTFKRFFLIAAFAIFTIGFTSINHCLGWDGCDAPITHPDPENCEYCGTVYNDICEIWHDGVDFHIHTHVCPICGYWTVYYHY